MYLDKFNDELFKGKYRIKSARLPHWDYGSDGFYFVTICTKNILECFGEIRNGIMGLNELGCVATQCWQNIPYHFPHVILDEWVIMPNHIHGVVQIYKPNHHCRRDAINRVSTNGCMNGGITGLHNPMLQMSLGRIMRWFKGRVSYEIHKINPNFQWQSRF